MLANMNFNTDSKSGCTSMVHWKNTKLRPVIESFILVLQIDDTTPSVLIFWLLLLKHERYICIILDKLLELFGL